MRTDREEAIAHLLIHALTGDLNEQEKMRLDAWLDNPEHLAVFRKICKQENIRYKLACLEHSDKELAGKRLKMNIAKRIRRRKMQMWLRVAAGLLIPLCVGGSVWFLTKSEVSIRKGEPTEEYVDTSLPVIRLASGEEICLAKDSVYNLGEGILASQEKGVVRYEPTANDERNSLSVKYHEIYTPRGTEYRMVLPDGTKVCLNAESSLRFPVAFSTGERRVMCDGEVFFDVARDSLRPFLVESAGNVVKVLGTRFDVRHYADEPYTAVLLSGSIHLTGNGGNVKLQPGEQARMQGDKWIVEPADLEMTSWVDGYFLFKNKSLMYIMKELARWYDIEVFYADSQKQNEYYSFEIERNSSLEQVMEILRKTRTLDVEINGRTVVIR